MKKALSIILAIVMVAFCVPVVSAYDFPEQAEKVFEAYCDYYGSVYSVYTKDGVTGEIGFAIENLYAMYDNEEVSKILESLDFDYGIKNYAENNPEKLKEFAEELNSFNGKIDEWLKENGYTVVIDATALGFVEIVGAYYDYDTSEAWAEFMDNNTDIVKAEEFVDMYNESFELLEKVVEEGLDAVTQEEFDYKATALAKFYMSAMDCFEGRHDFDEYTDLDNGTHTAECSFCTVGEVTEAHTFSEYISNGDATTEADGTKTAKCTCCDATDTVTDEGSKLVKDIAQVNLFDNIIQTIKNFFESIINLFKNLFK